MSKPPGRATAQPGTIAHKAIAHLQTMPEGYECTSAVLATAIGQPVSSFGQYLRSAADNGLLNRRLDGRIAYWSLGTEAPADLPPPPPIPMPKGERAVQSTVSALAAPSIFAFAAERGAAPFSVALSTDGRITCERHGRVVLELNAVEAAELRRVAHSGVRP